jgi:hypothetical protein
MTASAQARLIDIPPLACKGTNAHVHLMYSDRLLDGIERALERMFSRYNAKQPELGGCRKDSGGLSPLELRANVLYMRKTIADLQNEALADSGHKARVITAACANRASNASPKPLGASTHPRHVRGREGHLRRSQITRSWHLAWPAAAPCYFCYE